MYIDIPDYCVAYNAKVGCTSLSRAIITRYFPEHEEEVARFVDLHHAGPISFTKSKRVKYAYKPVVLMVRHPVERFISAINQVGIEDIDLAIEALEYKSLFKLLHVSKPIYLYQDIHFKSQYSLLSHENHLFRFPEHVRDVEQFLGLGYMMVLNKSVKPKPILNDSQRERILSYYKLDMDLYDTIKHGNTVIMSKMMSEWRRLYHNYFLDINELETKKIFYREKYLDWPISKSALEEVKCFVRKYPYMRSIVVNYLTRHFLSHCGI